MDDLINIDESQTKASALNDKIVTFLDIIDIDFKCAICFEVSDEPVRCDNMCANIFCNVCMKESLTQLNTCPVCKKDTTAKKDVLVRNQIMKQKVFCINRKALSDMKCTWTGRYDELSTHLRQCDFELEVCTNDGCEESIERRDLESHLQACIHRIENCDHCMVAVKASMMEDHLKECPKFEVLCECKLKFTREKMDEHRDKYCQMTEIECEVKGCGTIVMRRDYLKHQKDALVRHVRLLSAGFQRLNSVVGPNPSQIKWTLTDIAVKLQEGQLVRKSYDSPTFNVNFCGIIKLHISVYIEDSKLGLYLYKDVPSNDSILNVGGSSFTITKDGLSDKKMIFSDPSILHKNWGWETFLDDMTPYIDNDGINITLDLELKIVHEQLLVLK